LLRAQRGNPSFIGTCSTRVLGTDSLVTYEIIDFGEAETVGEAVRGGSAALGEEGVGIAWFVGAWTAVGVIACIRTRR
jgi:multisubunit Na+/H+ antiporter MnhB subunit